MADSEIMHFDILGTGMSGHEHFTPKQPSRWQPLIYVLLGQCGWFAAVLSAAHGVPWIGTSVVLLMIAAHLKHVDGALAEFKLVLCVTAIGTVWESALVFLGVLEYPSGMLAAGVAPYWIPALWALFAAQVNTSYGWLKPRILLASLVGAIAGPLSFRAGVGLGALRFVHPWPALIALAVGWSVLLPVTMLLSRRWDGVTGLPRTTGRPTPRPR